MARTAQARGGLLSDDDTRESDAVIYDRLGVDVYSAWPMPLRYRRLNRTSMATPHVVERLRAAGLEEDRVMAALGTVTGSIDPARVDALRTVDGVEAVEPARDHRLPPPEADLQ